MINKVELEKLQVGLLERISPHLMGARISLIQEDLIGHILLRVKGFVWAETKSTRHQEVQYPRDWREAIKERWAPAWGIEAVASVL